MKTCSLCLNQYEKLAKSHIIPRGFFKNFYRIHGDNYPILLRRGMYVDNILCVNCDQLFGQFDDHAISLLRDTVPFHFTNEKCFNSYIYENYNYKKFKLFVMSLIFRMHFADLNFFSYIKVPDKIIIDLREKLKSKEVGKDNEYFFVVAKTSRLIPEEMIINSSIRRIDGYIFIEISLPKGFYIYVKTDSRPKIPKIFKNYNSCGNKLIVFQRGENFEKELIEYSQSMLTNNKAKQKM